MATSGKNEQHLDAQVQEITKIMKIGEESLQESLGFFPSDKTLSKESIGAFIEIAGDIGKKCMPVIRKVFSNGREICLKFLREITSSIMADGFSWSRVLLVIIIASAVIGVIGLSVFAISSFVSFLCAKVGTWTIVKGALLTISAIA